MSADDFQTKYASVMESMLKSAVAETTKLFETMVDELKAEISRIKKENEDLRTRCSQFEKARRQPTVYTGKSEPLPGRSGGPDTCDTAVQCELVPFRTMLVEQCQPLRQSSLQNQEQQCSFEEMEYSLQEHNYVTHEEGNSQMAFILVKQESVLKQEEVEPNVVYGQVLSDTAGTFINQACSTVDMPLPQRHGETRVALELPCVGMDSGLQGAQNQSSELEHSLVISLAAIKDDMEEESEVSQKIKDTEIGTQEELIISEKQPLVAGQHQSEVELLEISVVPQQRQREGETSVNEQIDVTLQQYGDVQSIEEQLAQPTPLNKGEVCNELKNGVEECKDSSQPDLPVRRRRGRPPKKAKHPGQPIKEILNSPSSDIPREQGVKNSPTIRMEEVEVFPAVDTVNITSSKSPQATPVQPEAFSSIITLSVQEKANSVLGDVESSKVGSLAVSIASLSRRCSSEKEKPSQSQQLPMDTEKGAILVPSSEVSSVVNTLYTPPAESPQTLSMNPRERCTSVTLQDALLLVEAMNQSLVENTFSSPQRMAAPYQTQCPSRISTLQTVDEVPAELQTPRLPIETCEASSTLPVTELSTTTQSAIEKRGTTLQTTDAASTHNSTTTSMPSPTAAIRSVQSFQQHCHLPLITLLASSRQGKAEPNKILVVPRSVSSLMPHKTAAQSSTQLPTVATQNNSTIPGSTAAGLPLGKHPLSSVPRKTIYVISRKLPPVVSSQSTTTKDLQSVIPPYPKITIIIPRQVSAGESSKHQSQTVVLTTKQESPKSTGPVTLSSSQLISSPQELSVSVDTQTQFGGVSTIPSQKRDNTSDKWESLEQTASVSEINAPSDIFSSLNLSVGPEPTSVSSVVPPTFEQNVSAVVKLTRLPFPMSTKESVLVSTLPTNGSSETPVAVSVNTSQMSEEPNYIQEKASFSSENCTILGKSFDSGYVQSSTPSKVSAPVNTTELSGVSGTAGEPTSNLDEEMISIAVQDCMSPNDVPIEKKQSAGLVHLTSITSKDISDPHLQMTKAQFLAQLEVSPVMQDPEKASSNDSVDARVSCAETSTSDKKRLQKNSLMTQLRCHLKNHFQARRTETNPELCTETETPTVSLNKTTLGNDSPNDKNTTSKPNHGSPINPGAVERVVSIEKTTIDPTPISPMRSGLCEDGIKSKSIVNEPASVSSRRSKAASESTPVSPRSSSSGQDDLGSKNKKSTSVSPRRSNSTKESASPKKTKNISLSSRRSSSTKSTSSRQIKNISVSPGRSSSTKESASPNKTKNTFVHPRRTTSTRDGASLKNTKTGDSPNITKTTSVRPKRTSSSRDGATPKKTKSTSISPRTSSLSESDSSPNISTSQSTSVNRRKCTFTKDGSSTKQIKGKSNSFSPRRFSITTDGAGTKNTKSEIGSPSVRWPKLGKDGVSPRKTGESTPAKKPKLIQDGTDPKNNLQVLNAKKLAKAAKAKTLAKMKNLNQSKLQNGAKTSCLADNRASCEAVKKFTAKAVWTPPRIPASRTTSTGGKRSLLLPVKKETRSQDHTVVYPHSVSLHPIPVKAPPIVSPLQPLSVIGRRLLKNQCGECGRVLSSGAALESHVSLHAGHRPYSCTLCGKRFPDSKGLKRHGRVHRNGRIHICQQCGKGFVYRFGLTKHLQMVHGRIKPFVCQICNKGFFTKRDVEAHIRIHTGEKPFHCNLCDKKFTRRVELNVHLRWHNGEKRHWCPYCGKGFLDFNNLKRHKYIHTGEKPHSCPHCPKNFTQSGHLKKHVKNVHKTQ